MRRSAAASGPGDCVGHARMSGVANLDIMQTARSLGAARPGPGGSLSASAKKRMESVFCKLIAGQERSGSVAGSVAKPGHVSEFDRGVRGSKAVLPKIRERQL